jgi:hypothetical protein
MLKQIDDAGVKIGGARKDWREHLTPDKLAEMNELEKRQYVVKQRIWTRLGKLAKERTST